MNTAGTNTLARRHRSRWWLLGLVLLVGFLFMGGRLWHHVGLARGVAPPLAGMLLNGTPYDLKSDPAKTKLVYFWASWCPDCRREQATIDALARDHDLITVAMQSGADAEVRQHLAQSGLHWRVLNDPQGGLSRNWGVIGVPSMVIVDGHGNLRFRVFGNASGTGLRLRLWLAERF